MAGRAIARGHFLTSFLLRRDKAASTVLRLVTVLDILFKYASARADRRAPRIRSLLTRLATKPGEKWG
jgi:hypothetical protein